MLSAFPTPPLTGPGVLGPEILNCMNSCSGLVPVQQPHNQGVCFVFLFFLSFLLCLFVCFFFLFLLFFLFTLNFSKIKKLNSELTLRIKYTELHPHAFLMFCFVFGESLTKLLTCWGSSLNLHFYSASHVLRLQELRYFNTFLKLLFILL